MSLQENIFQPQLENVYLECHRPGKVVSYQRILARFLALLDTFNIPHSKFKSCHISNFLSSELTEIP